jgi:hypothetical protein
MPQAVDSIAPNVEQLSERLRELERRVAALEHSPATPPSELAAVAAETRWPNSSRGVFPLLEMPSGAVPILGKAVLGIAGAYLLRAIAESGTVPKFPVLMVAIVYAALWMVWAVRTHDTNRFASITYSVTSALILSPLLWESTVRFQVLSPAFSSVVLSVFFVLTLALAWQRNLQVIPWVATLAAVTTALALIIATHELVPLTAALLTVALATETAACLGHRLSLRAVPAISVDFAVWVLIDVMTSSEGIPEAYHPVAPVWLAALCFALLGIYSGSIGIRSFGLRQRITTFEIGQAVMVFVLAFFCAIRVSHGEAPRALGVLFSLLAAACYWGLLARFAEEEQTRNRRVCTTSAAALLLAGSFLLFPSLLRVPFWCLAAVATAFVYTRTHKLSVGLHTSFYLVAAIAVSSLPIYVGSALAGTVPSAPDWDVSIIIVSAAMCYAIASRVLEDQGRRRLLWVVPASVVGFSAAALAVVMIAWLSAGRMELNASRLSVVRTVGNCALALALGFLSSRTKRVELAWVAYAAVAFGTLKLLFEDLRFGNAASLVVSLLFYGLILILLPRLTRPGQK